MIKIKVFLFLLILITLCSCNFYNKNRSHNPLQVIAYEEFIHQKQKLYDVSVFWIVDNSNEDMENIQEEVANNIDILINHFYNSKIGFKLGVTTTDPADSGEFVIHQGADEDSYILSSDTHSKSDILRNFKLNIQVGSEGAEPQGLRVADDSVWNTKVELSKNYQFLQEKSVIILIIISNSGNSEVITGHVKSLKDFREEYSNRIFIVPIVETEAGINYINAALELFDSYSYVKTILKTDNLENIFDINDPISDAFEHMKEPLLQSLERYFYLKYPAYESRLFIRLNGVLKIDGWSLHDNSLIEFDVDNVPPGGTWIRLNYNYID